MLFGLSMDYQVFLLSRIHERWSATGDTAGAIVHGVASTARLITGAAAIIIVVFTGFATGQLVAFQEMGFGIAIALALDATLVRLLLIPAAMRLLGERNWYLPRWLAWLPDLQVEGQPPATAEHRRRSARRPAVTFPGWPWVAVALAFPVAGLIGWKISGPVDTVADRADRRRADRSRARARSSGGPPRGRWDAQPPGSARAPPATPPDWQPAPPSSGTTPISARSS